MAEGISKINIILPGEGKQAYNLLTQDPNDWERGTQRDGTGALAPNDTNRLRLKDTARVSVVPKKTYHIFVSEGYRIWVSFWDANGKYVGTGGVWWTNETETFKIKDKAVLMRCIIAKVDNDAVGDPSDVIGTDCKIMFSEEAHEWDEGKTTVNTITVPVTSNAKQTQELMTSDQIELDWTQTDLDILPAGSYVNYDGQRYTLLEPYQPEHTNEVYLHYAPKFVAEQFTWHKYPFFLYTKQKKADGTEYVLREPSWTLTDTPQNFMAKITEAIERETGEKWAYETVEDGYEKGSATITFEDTDILSALNSVADAFGSEWWVDKASKTVHLKTALTLFSGEKYMALEVGKNVGMPSAQNNKEEEFFNRYVVFGSTRNITQDAQLAGTNTMVNRRLTLDPTKYPEGYIDAEQNPAHVYTKILYYEDIYPHADLKVSDVLCHTKESDKGDGDVYCVYYFRLVDGKTGKELAFNNTTYVKDKNPEGMKIAGLTLSINFKTGSLRGREFEMEYMDTARNCQNVDGTSFTVPKGYFSVLFIEENGFVIPSEGIAPKDGDEAILFNCRMPDEYIATAQAELEKAALKDIANYEQDCASYTVESYKEWWRLNGAQLVIGSAVTLDKTLRGTLYTRVTKIERSLDAPYEQTITVGNERIKGAISTLREQMEMANEALSEVTTVARTARRASQSLPRRFSDVKETTEALAKSLLNGFTDKVSPITIQTMQTVVGSESLQFRFLDNVSSDVEITPDFRWEDGTFTVSPCAIEHLTYGVTTLSTGDNATVKSQRKRWNIEGALNSGALDADKTYYLYIRAVDFDKQGKAYGNAVWMLTEEAHEMKDGYEKAKTLWFLTGILSAEQDGDRSWRTMYGYTEITPGHMTIDEVVSADGKTGFDLKNGEIWGNISFGSKRTSVESALASTLASAKSYTDGMEIGGRNLIVTKDVLQWTGGLSGDTKQLVYSQSQSMKGQQAIILTKSLVAGQQYTFSWGVATSDTAFRFYISEINLAMNLTSWNSSAKIGVAGSVTFTATEGYPVFLILHVYATTTTWTYLKLEHGNKATDWTPAPEDVDSTAQGYANSALGTAKTYADGKASDALTSAKQFTTEKYDALTEETKKKVDDAVGASETKLNTTISKAQTAADNAKKEAVTAQNNASTAIANAKTANDAISKINTTLTNYADDGKISPMEKTALKAQMAEVKQEYSQITAEAGKYGVTTTTYKTAYDNAISAFNTYTASSPDFITINSTTYGNIAKYYEARTTILNSIATAAKKIADDAQTAADKAKTAADNAKKEAVTAQNNASTAIANAKTANDAISKINTTLTNYADDGKISPTEKTALKAQMAEVKQEYSQITAEAGKYGVTTTTYKTAYDNAISAFNTYTASSPDFITINSTTYGNIAKYYEARTTILNSIATAAKKIADDAQTAADKAQEIASSGRGNNLWPYPYFVNKPWGFLYSACSFPLIGQAIIAKSRDHYSGYVVPLDPTHTYRIECTAYRSKGTIALRASFWWNTGAGWAGISDNIMEDLGVVCTDEDGHTWHRYVVKKVHVYNNATGGKLYFQVNQSAEQDATRWYITDVAIYDNTMEQRADELMYLKESLAEATNDDTTVTGGLVLTTVLGVRASGTDKTMLAGLNGNASKYNLPMIFSGRSKSLSNGTFQVWEDGRVVSTDGDQSLEIEKSQISFTQGGTVKNTITSEKGKSISGMLGEMSNTSTPVSVSRKTAEVTNNGNDLKTLEVSLGNGYSSNSKTETVTLVASTAGKGKIILPAFDITYRGYLDVSVAGKQMPNAGNIKRTTFVTHFKVVLKRSKTGDKELLNDSRGVTNENGMGYNEEVQTLKYTGGEYAVAANERVSIAITAEFYGNLYIYNYDKDSNLYITRYSAVCYTTVPSFQYKQSLEYYQNKTYADSMILSSASDRYVAIDPYARDGYNVFLIRNGAWGFTVDMNDGMLQRYVDNKWYRANPLVCICTITFSKGQASASASYNPLGWDSNTLRASRDTTGRVKLYHGLNHTKYAIQAHGVNDTFGVVVSVVSYSAKCVEIFINRNGSAQDRSVELFIFDYSNF